MIRTRTNAPSLDRVQATTELQKYAFKMNYTIQCGSTREPIDALAMHVFARAYRDAWLLLHACEPLGQHMIEELDLMMEFTG